MKENKKDTLGNRQKSYERVNESYLVPKMPYIIRMDGMAFHTFTKGFTKPFDQILQKNYVKAFPMLLSDILRVMKLLLFVNIRIE